MKSVLKIVSYVLLSITGLIAVVFGYAFITGALGEQHIPITELYFDEQESMVIENFFTKLNFMPEDATHKDITLSISSVGSDVVEIPSTVKAGEEFEVKLKKDENGNNIGGEVRISAQTSAINVTEDLVFWVDIVIPNNGLIIDSNIPQGEIPSGGGVFDVYVFTNPKDAIYPHKSHKEDEFDFLNGEHTYKDISLTSENENSLKVLGQGVKGIGYYNPNHKENQYPVFINLDNRPQNMKLDIVRYVKFSIEPGVNSQNAEVLLTSKSLRTYFMEQDFVDVNSSEYENDQTQAYADFSNYINKYRHYIETDEREYWQENELGQLVKSYKNGADFLNAVTQNQRVIINPANETAYNAAMFYLYINSEISYTVQDSSVAELTTSQATYSFDMLEDKEYEWEELVSAFALQITPNSNVNKDVFLRSKINKVKVSAVMGQQATESDENFVEGKITLVEELSASEYIKVENPNPNLSNPTWKISAIKPTSQSDESFVGLKIYLNENGKEHYSLVKVEVNNIVYGRLTLKVGEGGVPEVFATNKSLNAGFPVNSINLDENIYTIDQNATYKTVKFFVIAEDETEKFDAKTSGREGSKLVFQPNEMNEEKEITIRKENDSKETYDVYEISHRQLIALNVTQPGYKVGFFAATIKTNSEGKPVDENGEEIETKDNYIFIEKSNYAKIEVESYIDKISFYSFEEDVDGNRSNFQLRSGIGSLIKVLHGSTYQLALSNSELLEAGTINPDKYEYYESSGIDKIANERFALSQAARYNWLEVNVRSNQDHEILEVEKNGSYDFEYDETLDYVVVTLNTPPISGNLGINIEDDYTAIRFDLYAEYGAALDANNIPKDLEASTVPIDIEFAKINDDLRIHYTHETIPVEDGTVYEATDDTVNVKATPTSGKVQWNHLLDDGELGTVFNLTRIGFTFDIQDLEYDEEDGEYKYKNPKLDEMYRDTIFDPENEGFISDYANSLTNRAHITISSSDTDYATIVNHNGGTRFGINIIKGEPKGKEIVITATVSIYNAGGNNYLQTKTTALTLKIIQEEPRNHFYSERTENDMYIEVEDGSGDYVFENGVYKLQEGGTHISLGEHYILNDTANRQIMKAGSSINLLGKLPGEERRAVYSYNKVSDGSDVVVESVKNDNGDSITDNMLLDVRFAGSEGSIIGEVKFEIVLDSEGKAPIYFLNDAGDGTKERSYSASATMPYELVVYASNSSAKNALAEITVSTTYSNVPYTYYIQVENNIDTTGVSKGIIETSVNMPSGTGGEIELSDLFKITQNINETKTLNLPIRFEIGYGWGEIFNDGTTFDVTKNLIGANAGHVLKGEQAENIEMRFFNTGFRPYMVMSEKSVALTMYYYVPILDEFGNNIYVADFGGESPMRKIYEDNENPGNYYYTEIRTNEDDEEEIVRVPYSGSMEFLFEEILYEDSISTIKVLPTFKVNRGENLEEPIAVKSGSDYELFNIEISDSASQTNTTNFIDVLNITQNPHVLLLPGIITDYNNVDYSGIYNKFIRLSIDNNQYPQGSNERAIFDNLNAQIDENGVLKSNPINQNLEITIIVNVYEGKLDGNGKLSMLSHSFNIRVMFENTVRFKVSNEAPKQNTRYLEDAINPHTNEKIGHVFKGLSGVETDGDNHKKIIVEHRKNSVPYAVELFSLSNQLNENVVNIVGGSEDNEQSLLPEYLSQAVLYWHNGFAFEKYNNNDVEVKTTKNQNGNVSKVEILIHSQINGDRHFMIDFEIDNFDIEGGAKYYFSIVSDMVVKTNYPVYNDYEVVQKGTTINLHSNYINSLDRIEIYIKEYTETENENEGDYIKIANGLFVFVGENKGDYNVNLVKYNIRDDNGLKLVSEGKDGIAILPFSAPLNSWFEYSLLNSDKQEIAEVNELQNILFPIKASDSDSGTFTFSNITENKVLYIRVKVLEGDFVDYKLELKINSNPQEFDFENEYGLITKSNPLPVIANNENHYLDVFNYIAMQKGDKNDLIILYNSYGAGSVFAEQKLLNGEFKSIAMNNRILPNSLIRFEDVGQPTLVSFLVYGKDFTSGMDDAGEFYVLVLPNFIVETKTEQVAAGVSINLVAIENGENSNNAIFNILGNTDDVEITINKVGNDVYGSANSNNFYAEIKGVEGVEQFIINDIQTDIVVEFRIKKYFDDTLYIELFKEITIKPNVSFVTNYNDAALSNYEITAPPANTTDLWFNDADNPHFYANNLSGINRLKTSEDGFITLTYSLLTVNNIEITEDATTSYGVAGFNAITGNFTVLSVNSEKSFKLRLTVVRSGLAGTDTVYDNPIVNHKDFIVKIVPRMQETVIDIKYKNTADKTFKVLEGSVIEINFADFNLENGTYENFAVQGEEWVSVDAYQEADTGTKAKIHIVMLLQETNRYRMFIVDDNKYYIEFKSLDDGGVVVNIELYFDLTNTVEGFKNETTGLYHNINHFIAFSVEPAISSISLNTTQGQTPNSQESPHIINTESMMFVDYGDGNGDFEFSIDTQTNTPTYTYVGENSGRFILKESVVWNNVGEGNGDFSDETFEGFSYYKFVGEGEGSFELTSHEKRYVYLGHNLGNYKKDENSDFNLVENGLGDYVLLGHAQVDLFELFTLNLNANVSLDKTDTSKVYVGKHLLRNSVKFSVSQYSNSITIKNGIAEFAPKITEQDIVITASLYGMQNQTMFLHVRVGQGGVLTTKAIDDKIVSQSNPIVITIKNNEENPDEKTEINLKDHLIYGFSGGENIVFADDIYDLTDQREIYNNFEISYSDNSNITLIKRTSETDEVEFFMAVINLDMNLLSFVVPAPEHDDYIYENHNNGTLLFKSYSEIKTMIGDENESEIIRINAQIPNGESVTIFIKIVLHQSFE